VLESAATAKMMLENVTDRIKTDVRGVCSNEKTAVAAFATPAPLVTQLDDFVLEKNSQFPAIGFCNRRQVDIYGMGDLGHGICVNFGLYERRMLCFADADGISVCNSLEGLTESHSHVYSD